MSRPDVLFGQSYYLRFDAKLWEAMQPYPPLGTLYAASYLREQGYDVALFDAMLAENEQSWASALDRHRPDYAVIYEDNFNYLSKMCLLRMREAAFTMSRMAKERGCTVIVCGSDATDHAAEYFAHGVDYVLLGEGEITLCELMDRLTGRTDVPLASIAGMKFPRQTDVDGEPDHYEEVVTTPPRPILRDLDSLPFPAWDLVDVSRYQEVWYERHGYYSMNVATTRGCPYHCNWCAKPIWGQRYNVRSPENVVAELKWLQEEFSPDHIWFVDDIMGLKPGWLERFADLVEEEAVRTPFKSLNRVDLLLRDGDIEALKRAGCQIVWVGAESGSQKILDAMEKGSRVEQIYEVARRLHDAGIKVGFFLQFGYPGETREDVEKTLQMVRECRPDDIGMSVSYPLPGTTFHERVKDELGVKQNWQDSNDLAMLYQGPYTTAFYRQLHTVLHKEFRMRKHWTAVKRLLQGHEETRLLPKVELLFHRAAASVYHALTLPLARYRLNRLEKVPHTGVKALSPGLDPEAAATPTPQTEQR